MLALIAGTGDLPPAIVAGLHQPPLTCALLGNDPTIDPAIVFRIEHLGSFIAQLQAAGVTQICMAGAIARPTIDMAQIDAATVPMVPRIAQALARGDDGALRIVIDLFQEAGLDVIAAHEILPSLLPPVGVLTQRQPDPVATQDAAAGVAALFDMARADIGQSCVVARGRAIAREGQDGTDAMLKRLQPATGGDALDALLSPVDAIGGVFDTAADWLGGAQARPLDAQGAILFKAPKPGQDRRADLPVIGPRTADMAAAAGLRGIVIEAGGVMVLDREETVAICDAKDLFLWVRPKDGT